MAEHRASHSYLFQCHGCEYLDPSIYHPLWAFMIFNGDTFIPFRSKLDNHLPESIKYLNIKCFKERLYKWLSLNPFYSYDKFFNLKVIDLYILIFVSALCFLFYLYSFNL